MQTDAAPLLNQPVQHDDRSSLGFIAVSCPGCSTKKHPVMISCDPSWPTQRFEQCSACHKRWPCPFLKHRHQKCQKRSEKYLPTGSQRGSGTKKTCPMKLNRKRLSIPSSVDVDRIARQLKRRNLSEVLSIIGSTDRNVNVKDRRSLRKRSIRGPPLGLTAQDWQDVTSALFAPSRACSQCWTTFTSAHVVHKTLDMPVSYSLCPTCFQSRMHPVSPSIVFNDKERNITPGMGARSTAARLDVPSPSTYVIVASFCPQCNSTYGCNRHFRHSRTMSIAILQLLPMPSWAHAELKSWECSECGAEVCPTLLDTATHGLFPIHCSTMASHSSMPSARITLDLSAPGRQSFIQHGSITWLLHLRMGAHITNTGMVQALEETASTFGCPFTPSISAQVRTDLLRVITMYGKSLTQRRTSLLPHDLASCLACAKRPKHPGQTLVEASLGGLSSQIWDGGSFAAHARRQTSIPNAKDPPTMHRPRWHEPDSFDAVLDSGHSILQDRSWLRSWLQIAAPNAASADVDDAPDSSSCSSAQRKMQCDNTPTSVDVFDTNLQNNTTFVGMCCHGILLRDSVAMTPGALCTIEAGHHAAHCTLLGRS